VSYFKGSMISKRTTVSLAQLLSVPRNQASPHSKASSPIPSNVQLVTLSGPYKVLSVNKERANEDFIFGALI